MSLVQYLLCQVGSGPKIGTFLMAHFVPEMAHCALVAHLALCLYMETGVHILPLVARLALCLYIETGVHILPLVAHSALHILPLVARSVLQILH